MRPSWPAPMMPIFMSADEAGLTSDRVGRARLMFDLLGTVPELENDGIFVRQNRGGEQRRVRRTRRPMASVPTGIPAGICTMESSESMPLSALRLHGNAQDRQRGFR